MIKVVFKSSGRLFGMDVQRIAKHPGADEATFVDDVLVIKKDGQTLSMVPRENVEQVIIESPITQA
jgi:hypothetical protein